MQTQPDQHTTMIDGFFYLAGFVFSATLTAFDYYTSFTGIQEFATPAASDIWRVYFPLCLSGVAVTFVACSTTIIERFFSDHSSPKTMILLVSFVAAVVFDVCSSFVGTLVGLTGARNFHDAFTTSGPTIFLAGISACLMILGSTLVSKFFHLLRTAPGMIGDMFRGLGGN